MEKLVIATGQNRWAKLWKNTNIPWVDLIERLKTTTRTSESVGQYINMTKSQQDNIKDVGGFVGGSLKQGKRKSDTVDKRYLLTLDADFADYDFIDRIDTFTNYNYCIYSTHKHTNEKPRLRLLIPLNRPVEPDEYEAISRLIADDIGIDLFDDTTYQASRLMYWPSTSLDGEYVFKAVHDKGYLDANKILNRYSDWKDISSWPVSSRTVQIKEKILKKQEDPTSKKGIVGAFCRTYTAEDVLNNFLLDVYDKCGINDRYTYLLGSSSAGVVLYDNGNFVYSNHATDPISGLLCNAFDLLRIHKFKDLDDEAEAGTPTVKLPSYIAMQDFASNDDHVKITIFKEKQASAKNDFSDVVTEDTEDKTDDNWILELDTTKKGEYVATIEAFRLILTHDKNLKGRVALNEFTGKYKVLKPVPWDKKTKERDWIDADDSGIRHYFEKNYNLKGKALIEDAWVLANQENRFHPVKDYLNSLVWDGKKRLETLFIDYLGATDNEYVRTVTKKTLTGAVARIFIPGVKFDTMLVLVGPQGCGKSQIVKRLGKDWFSDTLTTMKDKEAFEQIQGYWVIEIAELAAMKRMEVEAIKHFMAKSEDVYRAAYGRHTQANKRQCIFIGTTNTHEFLKDVTGNRRFWPVDVNSNIATKDIWQDLSEYDIGQIWAEAYETYKSDEKVYIEDDRIKALAEEEQDNHLEESPMAGDIKMFLDKLLPEDWNSYELSQRRQFLQGNDFGKSIAGTVKRTKVCPIEIWCEVFNGDKKDFTIQKSKEIRDVVFKTGEWEQAKGSIRCGMLYGQQKGFMKK